MQKFAKKLSVLMVALMTIMTVASYMPAKAATVVPTVKFVGEQKTEYKAGERITFNLNASNYGGRVQYRVVLWDDNTKSMKDLWNTADRYYAGWMPYGNETLPLGWVINEPGSYRITVYAKRAGLANSKTANPGANCDSYVAGPAFKVTAATATVESIAPVADVTVNEGETAVLPTEVTLNLTDKTTKTAKVTWAAVDTTKVGKVAVEGTVEGTDKKATANVEVKAVALAIKEVKAVNLKEMDVVFTKAVDEDNLGTYKIDKVALTDDDDVSLLEDGKTVRITFDAAKTNQKTYSLSVEDTKDVAANKLALTTVSVTVLDTTLPTIEKVEAFGNKKVTITFSEPVQADSYAKAYSSYKIDGKLVVGSGLAEVDNREVVLTLASALTSGEHELVVVEGKVSDFNKYTVAKNATKFTVVEDKVAPTYKVEAVAQEKITIKFSEEINTGLAKIYWKENNVKHYGTVSKDSADKSIVYVTFGLGHYVPLTETTLYVENATDYSGNVAAASSVNIAATPDITRPTVTSVTCAKEAEMIVTFSEKVNKATGIFVVKDVDGYVVSGVTVDYNVSSSGTVIKSQIKLSKAGGFDVLGNSYTVSIEKVEDLSALTNASLKQVFTVDVVDTTAPSVSTVTKNGNAIAIAFNEKVNSATLMDPANYAYFEAGVGYVAFPSETTFTALSNGKTVLVTLPASWKFQTKARTIADIAGATAISVKNIADLTGNVMFAQLIAAPAAEVAATVSTAKATDKNTVVLTLSGTGSLPAAVYAGDFVVENNATTKASLTVVDASVNATKRTITLKINEDIPPTATYDAGVAKLFVKMASTVQITKTALGTALALTAGTQVEVKDAIAATVDADKVVVKDNTVTLTFDEDINFGIAADVAELAKAFIIKDSDGNRLLPGTQYTVAKNANSVVISVKDADFEDVLKISLDGIYLTDTLLNSVNSFEVTTGNDVVVGK